MENAKIKDMGIERFTRELKDTELSEKAPEAFWVAIADEGAFLAVRRKQVRKGFPSHVVVLWYWGDERPKVETAADDVFGIDFMKPYERLTVEAVIRKAFRELRIRANLKACVREQTIFVRLREKAA